MPAVRLEIVGLERDGLSEAGLGFRPLQLFSERAPHVIPTVRIAGVKGQRSTKGHERPIHFAHSSISLAQVGVKDGIARTERVSKK
jgi:hypothetical protein